MSKIYDVPDDLILRRELLHADLVRILFQPGVQPTDAEIIERVRELQAYWEQMHQAGRRD